MSPDENQQPTNNEEEPQEDENMKLYRDEKQNSAELLEVLNKCDTISYNRRKNTFTFYAHEGALLEDVENADNMDLVKLANALDKRYFLEATIGCSNWNWDDEDEEDEKQEDEPKAEDQATETKKEDKHMKKRFFYLADIDSTFAVTPMTKKEIISIGQELKELCEFMSDDQTISGYTKDGRFFYYDNSNFDSFKKSDIINAVSVIYSDESGDYYWGGFDINEWGVAGPTEDGSTIIADHENIKEVESADYSETEETAEEPKAEEPAAEKPAENKTDSAFITEMLAALGYFKRVLWSYTEAECCTRSERDISGDFWGAHECSVILSFVNDRLKAQGAEPHYKLKNDFDDLSECFEEIMQKFEYGDERTIEEIIAEYNFS